MKNRRANTAGDQIAMLTRGDRHDLVEALSAIDNRARWYTSRGFILPPSVRRARALLVRLIDDALPGMS